MKLLHTSDWHLGRSLYGRKRYDEYSAFLNWMLSTLQEEQIDCLIIAGDIFDTTTPSNTAQELYYDFLVRVAQTCCHNVVVVGGNHDSPAFLQAPRGLLRSLNVHVVGARSLSLSDDVLTLTSPDGEPQLIVGAVPYLRDRDLRRVELNEEVADREAKLTEGVRSHYAQIGELADGIRRTHKSWIPLVLTGHLFAAGGHTVEGDGMRELYVGSLARINAELFPTQLDYLALGHLHSPQTIGANSHMRYSGSPIPMGFGEAGKPKSVSIVSFEDERAEVKLKEVPQFQRLVQIKGDWPKINQLLTELMDTQNPTWVEIVYVGNDYIENLRERVEKICQQTSIEILQVKNNVAYNAVLKSIAFEEKLEELSVIEVFGRCLEANGVETEHSESLTQLFAATYAELLEDEAAEAK